MYSWLLPRNRQPPSTFPTTGAIASRLYILQADADPDDPDVTFTITTPDPATFAAASEQTIVFTFVPINTPIKDW